jgi:peptidyl-prolyl cis-trans isomerase SurA
MNSFLLTSLLLFLGAGVSAQFRQPSLEEAAARRWSLLNADRIAADADGQGITLSDVRRQIDPIVGQIRAAARTDLEFDQALKQAAEETLRSMAERQLVIAEFRANTANLPASYIDGDIEETIRRDFGGDRNRFVASLRAAGTTPLAYRKTIEDRIIFEFMVGQIRRRAWDVNPGKIQEYYDKNKADFLRKEQVKLRQITLTQGAAEKPEETAARAAAWADALAHPAKIAELLERYKVGGKPAGGPLTFADVAERISADDYARKGGDTGWRNVDDLNQTVVQALRTLKPGQVSAPLRFDVGAAPLYVIISPEDTRPKGYAPVSDPEVMTEIEGKVRAITLKLEIQRWLDEIRAKRLVQMR